MFVVSGIVAQLAGIAALRSAQMRESWAIWALSLVLLAASVWLMAQKLGWELGVTWALTTVSAAAYALILHPFLRAQTIGHSRAPRNARQMPAAPSGSAARLTLRLISAGPLYLIAALGLSLLIATKPWTSELTRLFIGGLSTPLFWSVGALHATIDPDLARIIWLPALLSAVSFGLFFAL